jgi:outer membrane protein assembly factor BamB
MTLRGRAGQGRGARRLLAITIATLSLAGCETLGSLFDFDGPEERLEGERISVMSLESSLEPDPRLADLQVRLPRPYENEEWPQAGGYPGHAMHHLALSETPRVVWRADIGSGSDRDQRIPGQPVVGGGRLYAMDARSRVSAFDLANGNRIWSVDLTPREENAGAIGGGIAFDRGRVFAATAYGEAVALDAATGTTLWREKLTAPARVPPTVDGNLVFVVGHDNQIVALDGDSGRTVWSYTSVAEGAGIVGAGNPAVEGGIVVAPFSSGDLVALREDSGRVAWTDSLIRAQRLSSVATINDIAGSPVIDRGRVYAISHSGRMVALDLRTGDRIWEQSIGGVQAPWVAGDFLFAITIDADLVCLSRRDGRIRWVRPLQRWERPKERKDPIIWYGPILASDRLVVVSNRGRALSVSPYTGEILGGVELPTGASRAPVVAGGMLFILTDGASIVAMK